MWHRRSLNLKYLWLVVLATAGCLMIMGVKADSAQAIRDNSAQLPGVVQSYSKPYPYPRPSLPNGSWANYECVNANEGNTYAYKSQAWISPLHSPAIFELAEMYEGNTTLDFQFNVLSTHCSSNMTPNSAPTPSSTLNLRTDSVGSSYNIAYVTANAPGLGYLNDGSIRWGDGYPSTNPTPPSTAYDYSTRLDVHMSNTYGCDANPQNDRFYAKSSCDEDSPPVNMPVRITSPSLATLKANPDGSDKIYPITIVIYSQSVAEFNRSNRYSCINPPRQDALNLNGDLPGGGKCGGSPTYAVVQVRVKGVDQCPGDPGYQAEGPCAPPIGSLDGVSCSAGITGWAFDPDSPATSLSVHVYFDGPFGTGTFGGSFDANLSRPDVNAAYGITGNHGFTIPIPSAYRAAGHSVYIHAIGIRANGSPTGGNPVIASSGMSYSACPPDIACSGISGATAEIGIPYTVRITITNRDGTIDIASGNASVVVAGGPTSTGTFGSIAHGGNSINAPANFAMTDPRITLPDAKEYSLTATVNVVGTNGVSATTTCVGSVVRGVKPYLRVFGGDVWAGGKFNTASDCTVPTNQGAILTWAESQATYNADRLLPAGDDKIFHGSAGQFTITSLLGVKQMFSVSNRQYGVGNTFAAKGLTFSNNTEGEAYGSKFDATSKCIPNYWASQDNPTQVTNGSTIQSRVGGLAAGSGIKQFLYPAGSTASLGGSITVKRGVQVAVFVEGNLYINGDITYDPAGRTITKDIPNFVLIVHGNIYIAPGVSRLDGLYVAQPNGASGGKVYTCAGNGTLFNQDTLYSTCGNGGAGNNTPLAINGALVAQQVKWQRTYGTLGQSPFILRPPDTTSLGDYPDFATGSGGRTRAAEVINYTPEMYLAPSPLNVPYDAPRPTSITSLPPIF
jgi:hypothetical protein